jgi:hypothetical protein
MEVKPRWNPYRRCKCHDQVACPDFLAWAQRVASENEALLDAAIIALAEREHVAYLQ